MFIIKKYLSPMQAPNQCPNYKQITNITNRKLLLLPFMLLFLFHNNLFSQQILPLNRHINQYVDHELNKINSTQHTDFKPLIYSKNSPDYDSLLIFNKSQSISHLSYIKRKLFYENFITVDTNNFHLIINPLFNFQLSHKENNNTKYYINTRGIIVKGMIGKTLAFQSTFYENQSVAFDYISDFVKKYRIIPGQGLSKSYNITGFDYAWATGLISYSPSKYFNFQFGNGKNFIGNGYRSLLLSDNSFTYPFFKITTNIWKFQYTNLYASLIDINAPHTYQGGFQRKYGTFHYLSYNLCKHLQIGLFEAVIWQAADSTGKRGFDINYLNPIIFYRPVEFSLDSPDNSLIGTNINLKISNKTSFYSQFILDDLDIGKSKLGKGFILDKYGYQLGLKFFDLFSINNLYFQTEYNRVQPYVYAHKTPMQNYAHYNQALAHPLGANFKESVSILNYRYKNIFVELKFNYALYGADTSNSHWGKDIFKSDFDAQLGYPSYGNKICQGVKTTLMYQNISLSYLLNPKTNMNLSVGYTNRTLINYKETKKSNYFYIAFRTSLINIYNDF